MFFFLSGAEVEAAFTKASPVVIAHAKVPSNQTGYPVLILQTATRFKTTGNGGNVANTSGYDIRPFSDSGCSISPITQYQLITYDGLAGTVEMRVQLNLSATVDVTIYLCYGNTALTTDGSVTTVWDSHYKTVLAFPNGSTLSLTDFSGNTTMLTDGTTSAGTGLTDGGLTLAAGANGVHDNVGSVLSGSGTYTTWIKPTWLQTDGAVHGLGLDRANAGNIFQTLHYSDNNLYLGSKAGNDGRVIATSYTLNQNAWNFLVVTWTLTPSASTKAYLNNVQIGTENTVDGSWTGGANNYYHIFSATDSCACTADNDELSDIVRSVDWNTITFNNEGSPSTFETLGTEGNITGGGGATGCNGRITLMGVGGCE